LVEVLASYSHTVQPADLLNAAGVIGRSSARPGAT
jgi:hypothetical protein